ncbi:MAG: 4-aminobutyrate--2-oxoglutarate transaminase [Chloroflexota bacterium]
MIGEGIRTITEIPGPKSRALQESRTQHVARGLASGVPIYPRLARGALVEDVDGNVFIDFTGGVGVLNTGHCHPSVVEAVKSQADSYFHTCFGVMMYEPYVALCQRLNEVVPGEAPKKTALVTTGAEAVENAVKIARCAAKRPGIVCFDGAFHGRTLLTYTMTSRAVPFRMGFQSVAPDIYKVPYAYCYRCVFGQTYPGCALQCAAYLETALTTYIGVESVAAIIAEPVQGEGGFVVPPPEFLPAVKKICEKHGLLYVDDEIQSGFGRTGRYFAIEHFGLEPDIVITAKSLAAGLPLAAVTGRAEVMDAVHVGGLGGTYAGNPLACAAALTVLGIMEKEDIVGRGQRVGAACLERFREMKEKYPIIGDVRGLGAMVAMEIVKDRKTKEPGTELTSKIVVEACRNGVITLKAGLWDNVIRVLVPLIVSDDLLQQGLNALEKAVASASR